MFSHIEIILQSILTISLFVLSYKLFQLFSSTQERVLKLKKELRLISTSLYKEYIYRLTIKETQEMVENIVDQGSTTIEKAHKAATDVTFELLEKLSEDKEATKAAKNLHNTIARGLYETLRITNKQFGNLTNDLLGLKKEEKKTEEDKDSPI